MSKIGQEVSWTYFFVPSPSQNYIIRIKKEYPPSMRVLVLTQRAEIAEYAKEALGERVDLEIHGNWKDALEIAEGADVMIADLVSLLNEPHKIEGYDAFALAKMSHENAKGVKLILIPAPADYELDSMMGWPDFLFAQFHNPIGTQSFRQAMRWIDWA